MGNLIKRKQIDLTLSKGTSYGSTNIPNLLNSDKMEDAFSKIASILDKLAPAKPPTLSAIVFTLNGNTSALPTPNTYKTGKICGSGASAIYITGLTAPKFATPSSSSSYVFDASSGSLKIVSTSISLGLTAGDDTNLSSVINSNKRITILDDEDYYIGIVGKENFWFGMRIQVQDGVTSALTPSTALRTMTVEHYDSNNILTGTKDIYYYIEDVSVPTVTNNSYRLNSFNYNSAKKISGVPVLDPTDANDYYVLEFEMSNVTKYFYLDSPCTFSSPNSDLVTTGYTFASTPSINDVQTPISTNPALVRVRPNTNKFRQANGNTTQSGGALDITLSVSDVLQQASTPVSLLTASRNTMRIDTISSESVNRVSTGVTSGSNFVKTGLTSVYDSSQALDVWTSGQMDCTYELQLEGGHYIYPYTNYTTYYPAGPNYSVLTNLMRWATFKIGTISNAKIIKVSTPNLNFPISTTSSQFKIYVLVGNAGTNTWQTGWLSASTSYTGTAGEITDINNLTDGANALNVGNSTSSSREINLCISSSPGTSYPNGVTGDVYIRLGWYNAGSNYRLTAVPTITSVQ